MDEPTMDDLRGAAEALRRVVEAAEDGRLVAKTPRDLALLRRIEGAVGALDALSKAPR